MVDPWPHHNLTVLLHEKAMRQPWGQHIVVARLGLLPRQKQRQREQTALPASNGTDGAPQITAGLLKPSELDTVLSAVELHYIDIPPAS